MDEERIGLVFAKTSELMSKITDCIQETASKSGKEGKRSDFKDSEGAPDSEYQERETLLKIRDALESLEGQLSSLQVLQQQQRYEKEAAFAEIRYSQKKLLRELKEYQGRNMGVIREAISFASEREENNDLLLPPYPSRSSHSAVSDNNYLSSFPSTSKVGRHERISNSLKDLRNSKRDHGQYVSRGPFERLKALIGAAAKTALTIVGVITLLNMAGFETRLRKRDNQFKILDLFQIQLDEKKGIIECPPGKVPMMENGEMRCVVKERVEVPFELLVATPDVNYG